MLNLHRFEKYLPRAVPGTFMPPRGLHKRDKKHAAQVSKSALYMMAALAISISCLVALMVLDFGRVINLT